jgi:hypothetical protein
MLEEMKSDTFANERKKTLKYMWFLTVLWMYKPVLT